MRKTLKTALLTAALSGNMLLATQAEAAQIFRQFTATGSNFGLVFGNGNQAAIDPLTFVFTVNFDNSANVSNQMAGLTVQSDPLNMATRTFSYSAMTDLLSFGPGTSPGGCGNTVGQACLFISNATSAAPALIFMLQSQGDFMESSTYTAGTRTVTFTDIGVPEPATWAMMMLGFGAAGGMMRYRRRRTTVSYAS
jgi:PEP-CTERM motif